MTNPDWGAAIAWVILLVGSVVAGIIGILGTRKLDP